MKQRKLERGITLIALVVTIIVLLILAGVSIQMLTGQTGILRNAQQAREETTRGQIKEDVQRDIMEKMIEGKKGDITADELYEILNNYFKDVPEPGEEANNQWNAKDFPESFPELKSKEGDYTFKLGDIYSGNLSETETPPIEAGNMGGNNLKKFQGEFVDIGLDINDTKKEDGTEDTTDDWRIFYVGNPEEGNRIFLIAADYVPVEKLTKWGIIGEGTTLGNLGDNGLKAYKTDGTYPYNVYWSSTPSWKGIEDADFMKLIKHTGYDLNSSKANSKAVSQLLNTGVWSPIKDNAKEKNKIEFAIGESTLEMWCAAWNAVVDESDGNGFKKIEAKETNNTGYYVSSGENKNKTYLYMNGTQSSLSNLNKLGENYSTFFPHTSSYGSCSGYWLASPPARHSGSLMVVICDGRVDDKYYGNYGCGVRPVVCLTSGVQLKKNKEKSNDTKIVYDLV